MITTLVITKINNIPYIIDIHIGIMEKYDKNKINSKTHYHTNINNIFQLFIDYDSFNDSIENTVSNLDLSFTPHPFFCNLRNFFKIKLFIKAISSMYDENIKMDWNSFILRYKRNLIRFYIRNIHPIDINKISNILKIILRIDEYRENKKYTIGEWLKLS